MPTKSFLLSLLFLATVATTPSNAKTTVAVLEIGKGGTVRQTTSGLDSSLPQSTTSVSNVHTFWSNLHNLRPRRYLQKQESGDALIPDLFNKADGGIVIGVIGNGVDIPSMKTVSALIDSSTSSSSDMDIVGHFQLEGNKGNALMKNTKIMQDTSDFGSAMDTSVEKLLNSKNGGRNFHTVAIRINEQNEAAAAASESLDKQITDMISSLKRETEKSASTYVLHVVTEDAYTSHESRRLEDEKDGEGEGEDDGSGSLFYGYGYYLDNGEYYTPYRTIFQIQYFNCVLWASVGLVIAIFYAISITLNMPLMVSYFDFYFITTFFSHCFQIFNNNSFFYLQQPDTLLFGASAKMMGE